MNKDGGITITLKVLDGMENEAFKNNVPMCHKNLTTILTGENGQGMIKKFFSLKKTQERPFVKVDFATFMCLMTIFVLGLFISLSVHG